MESFHGLSMSLDDQLLRAAARNDFITVQSLLRRRARVNILNEDLQTPLHLAVSFKISPNLNLVKLLLRNGANVNATNRFRNTPLTEMITTSMQLLQNIGEIHGFINNDPFQEIPSVWWSVVTELVKGGSKLSHIDRQIIFADIAQIDWKHTDNEILLRSGITVEPAGIADTLEDILTHSFNRKKIKKHKSISAIFKEKLA